MWSVKLPRRLLHPVASLRRKPPPPSQTSPPEKQKCSNTLLCEDGQV